MAAVVLASRIARSSAAMVIISPWKKWLPFHRRHFQVHFHEWKKYVFWFKFHWSLFPKGSIDNLAALVQVMAWHQTATSHYLKQGWPSSPMHIRGTGERWINYAGLISHCCPGQRISTNKSLFGELIKKGKCIFTTLNLYSPWQSLCPSKKQSYLKTQIFGFSNNLIWKLISIDLADNKQMRMNYQNDNWWQRKMWIRINSMQ